MLKTAFIGNENSFDRHICEWLSEHTDLRLILWTNNLSWAGSRTEGRGRRVITRFITRARRRGLLRVVDEALYYFLYRRFIAPREITQLRALISSRHSSPRRHLSEIEQKYVDDLRSQELKDRICSNGVDAIFAMCIDVYIPEELTSAPRLGVFLWHEGITPEYRGVYSPFWALARKDYQRLGYTLLKMNRKLDAGDIYVQGPVRDIDPLRDWHSYIGHKGILDSLDEVKEFLQLLDQNSHKPILRPDAVDAYYSYPTASGLAKIAAHRFVQKRTARAAPQIARRA